MIIPWEDFYYSLEESPRVRLVLACVFGVAKNANQASPSFACSATPTSKVRIKGMFKLQSKTKTRKEE